MVATAAPSAAEDRDSAPLQVAGKVIAAPRAARHIQHVDYLRAPVLQYPSASRRFGEQGRVVLRVLIGADGQAEKIELHEASAFQRLNEAAIEAAQRALYKPYTEDGVAQPAWALVALSFQLRR
jgi:protein TonB